MADQVLAQTSRMGDELTLECLHSVLQEIAAAAVEHDVTGILLGTRDETRVRILAFRRLVPKRIFGRSDTLSDADRDAVARLISGPPAEGELYGFEPVGWFRAQPKRSLVLEGLELELLNTFFKEPAHVAMVLRPAGAGPTRARFYIREANGFVEHLYRDLIVPLVSADPMVKVDTELAAREMPPVPEPSPRLELPPRVELPPRAEPLAFDQTEVTPARMPRVPGWVLRAAASLAITTFVLGYWWIAYSRQAEERAHTKRPPEVLADADRQAPPTALPDPIDTGADRLTEPGGRFGAADDRNTADEPHTPPQIPDPQTRLPDNDQPRQPPPKAAPPPVAHSVPEMRILRPLRVPAFPRRTIKVSELAAPPVVAREIPPVFAPPLPQSMTVVAPQRIVVPKAAPGPSNGSLIWTGRVRKNSMLVIEGGSASAGTLTGGLPGKPIQLHVYPGDLAEDGILVFTASSQDARAGWDSAGPQNGWNRVVYEFDPRSAGGVEVEEAPGPGNAWKRLVLRCVNPKISVIYVKWSLAQ